MNNYRNRIYSLKGSPFEIGLVMGRILGTRLEANIECYCRERAPTDARLNDEAWRSSALPWLRNLPDRFLAEFEGLAQGASLPLQRLAEWAYLDYFLDHQCSGGILTMDGKAWVVRNNDMYAPGLWGYASIRQVTGRIPTISFGMEGDVFTPTGINQEKLWLHYNYVDKLDSPAAGHPHLPAYAWIVEALETCRSLQDVETLLEHIQRDEGMLLFAVDGKTDEFALYECSCTQVHKRIPAQGCLIATNHYCTYAESPPPLSLKPLDTTSRYNRMKTLVEGTRSQPEHGSLIQELIRILADDAIERRTGEIVTAYSIVACPGTLEIWYTFGGYPAASQGDWHKLDWPW
jgi:Acyl-coenzyme A:6-aminopenicillanic acid acyl-transferase